MSYIKSSVHQSKLFQALSFLSILIFCYFSYTLWESESFIKISAVVIGEAFEAYHGALNIMRFGWQWAGLQDMATNPDASAHSVLYIHHPNFGLYFSYLLHVIGIKTIEIQNLLSGFATIFGLFTGWLLCRRLTKSQIVSAVFLIFLAIDFQLADRWAFNIHRAFQYLSLFLPVLFGYIWFEQGARFSYHLIFMTIGILLAFGQDYMAYFTVFLMLLFLPVCHSPQFELKNVIRYYSFIFFIFPAFFIARQFQVIKGAGIEIWKKDFLYQVLNRLHLEHLFKGDWSNITTDFYLEKSIINPGFAPYTDILDRLSSFLKSIGNIIISNVSNITDQNNLIAFIIGISFFILALMISLSGIFSKFISTRLFAKRIAYLASITGIFGVSVIFGYSFYYSWATNIDSYVRIIISLAATFTTLMLFFLPCNKNLLHIPKDQDVFNIFPAQKLCLLSFVLLLTTITMYIAFPTYFMLVFPAFLIAPTFLSIWTISILSPIIFTWESKSSIFISLSLLIIIKSCAIVPGLINNENSESYVTVLKSLKNSIVVSNFTPASISSVTHSFSGFVTFDGLKTLLTTGYIDPNKYFMLFERDKHENSMYRNPSYVLFYKKLGSQEQLDILKDCNGKLISESPSYALFSVPLIDNSVIPR